MPAVEVDDLLSTLEVCQFARRSRKTVQRWVNDGRLVPVKQLPGTVGAYLFARADVEALLAELAHQAS